MIVMEQCKFYNINSSFNTYISDNGRILCLLCLLGCVCLCMHGIQHSDGISSFLPTFKYFFYPILFLINKCIFFDNLIIKFEFISSPCFLNGND